MPTLTPQIRRAITNGLVAGLIIIFLIIIGIPGGKSDADSLPAWFAWALYILAVLGMAYTAARAHTFYERRTQTLSNSLIRGLVVGVLAAILTVSAMVVINGLQLQEIVLHDEIVRLGPGHDPTVLPSGLKMNVTRVQDIFFNVTPRTTAVMSGQPLSAIDPEDDSQRANPILGFILMSGMLIIAGGIGGSLSEGLQILRARREEAAQRGQSTQKERSWLAWVPILLPLLFFAFIVLNDVISDAVGPIGDAYRSAIAGNAQLMGLLASFFLVGAGLLALRTGAEEKQRSGFVRRAGILVLVTVILFGVGLVAPARGINDMLFSPRAPNLTQFLGPNGQMQVSRSNYPAVNADTLLNLQRVTIALVGALFVLWNLFAARSKTSLRRLLTFTIMLGTLAITPLYMDKYQQSVLMLVGINVMLGLGLNIVVGYAGLLDLGYVAFFAIGAYTYAFLASNQNTLQGTVVVSLKYGGNDQVIQSIAVALLVSIIVVPLVISGGLLLWRRRVPRVSPPTQISVAAARPPWLGYVLVLVSVAVSLVIIWALRGTPFYDSFIDFPAFIIGIIVGVVMASFAGVVLGIPVLRLRGDYLAIVTLGFGEIIRLFLNNLRDLTGGPQGITNIPHATFGGVEVGSNEGLLYLVLIGCLLIAFMSMRLKSSRLGRAWGALRSDEDIAQAMGINLVTTKVLAFAIGAAFAGIGGVVYAARQGSIFPENFNLFVSINVLSLIIIGGMGSIPGVIVGALVLIGVPESLRVFSNYRVMAFAVLLVAMMVLRPGGLLPEPPQPMERRAKLLANEENVA